MSVVWHDLECGAYAEDLAFWRSLAARHGDPVLDVGAGTGRVTLDLARHGHHVTALDRDPALLAELERRAEGLPVSVAVADARDFELGTLFALCLMPMQTIQLLDGTAGRTAFMRCAQRHLRPGGLLAMAIAEMLELYDLADGIPLPVPDMCEIDGVLYSSLPTAVRAESSSFVLERRRETVSAAGARRAEHDVVVLDRLAAEELEEEAATVGLRPAGLATIPSTAEYVGSTVVMLSA